jgi:hypothetical protein
VNARGTRRPRPRRVRSKPVKFSRSGKGGCAVLVLALAGGLAALGDALWWLIA